MKKGLKGLLSPIRPYRRALVMLWPCPWQKIHDFCRSAKKNFFCGINFFFDFLKFEKKLLNCKKSFSLNFSSQVKMSTACQIFFATKVANVFYFARLVSKKKLLLKTLFEKNLLETFSPQLSPQTSSSPQLRISLIFFLTFLISKTKTFKLKMRKNIGRERDVVLDVCVCN